MAQGKSRKFIKTFLDIPRWMGVSQLVAAGASIKSLAKAMMVIKQPKFEETFTEAVNRMGLSVDDLEKKQKLCLVFSLVYLASAIFMFCYMFYLFNSQMILSAVSAFALTVLLLAFFF